MPLTPAEVHRRLRRLNFHDLMEVDCDDPMSLTPKKGETLTVRDCCRSCEEGHIRPIRDDDNRRLTQITHGAHSYDFLAADGGRVPDRDWKQQGVLFLFENPGPWSRSFEGGQVGGKYPARSWYYVDEVWKRDLLPWMGYGKLVETAIKSFRLANAYAANLVKCGVATPTLTKDWRNLSAYNRECIDNCWNRVMLLELKHLDPQVVFTFGSKVRDEFKRLAAGRWPVFPLPHPAFQGGLLREFFQTLYYWRIARGLVEVGILGADEYEGIAATFLEGGEVMDWVERSGST
jgi:hypothetical protein